jgi:phosphopantothenoylcysteine decarboxylase
VDIQGSFRGSVGASALLPCRVVWVQTPKSDPVLHIELRRWADVFVIAPLSANTLAKISGGLCDNLLVRAPRVVAVISCHCGPDPVNCLAFTTLSTAARLRYCVAVLTLPSASGLPLPQTCVARAWEIGSKPLIVAPAMNTAMWEHPLTQPQIAVLRDVLRALVVDPVAQLLACGDVGVGAMASVDTIVAAVHSALHVE